MSLQISSAVRRGRGVRLRTLIASAATAGASVLATIGLAPPADASTPSVLWAGQSLYGGWSLQSPNGEFTLNMQGDGNLVEYEGTVPLWSTGTWGYPGAHVSMQTDGNLVVYSSAGQALWNTYTLTGRAVPGSYLSLQNDANLVVYPPSGGAIWADNAWQNLPQPGQGWETYYGLGANIHWYETWDGLGHTTVDPNSITCAPLAGATILGAGFYPVQPGTTSWCGVTANGSSQPIVGANYTAQLNCGLLGIIPYTWLDCVIDPFKINIEERATVSAPQSGGALYLGQWEQQCGGLTLGSPLPAANPYNCYQ